MEIYLKNKLIQSVLAVVIYSDLFMSVEFSYNTPKRESSIIAVKLCLFLANSCLFLYFLLPHQQTKNINVNVLQQPRSLVEKRYVSNVETRVKDDSHLDVITEKRTNVRENTLFFRTETRLRISLFKFDFVFIFFTLVLNH